MNVKLIKLKNLLHQRWQVYDTFWSSDHYISFIHSLILPFGS